MIYFKFLILALLIVFLANKLSKNAETIEMNSNLNAVMVGIILAFATSLPELATSITSSYLGESTLAISNLLGSNLFNLVLLSLMNIIFFKQLVNQKISFTTNKINLYVLLMYVLTYFTLICSDYKFLEVGRFSIVTILILIIYIITIRSLNYEEEVITLEKKDSKKCQKAIINFVILALIILFVSIELAITANQIILISGLTASFVGAIFIGISTSLPELTSIYTLCKSKKYDMAASSVLGSNLFNFTILFVVDLLSKMPLFSTSGSGVLILIKLGMIFSILTFLGINFKIKNRNINIIIPSLIIFIYVYMAFLGA